MASKSPSVEIEVDDRVVRVSNPDRVYFPPTSEHPGGATKLDLVEYYLVRRRRHRQRAPRAAVHAAPLPQGPGRRQGAPEAAAGRGAAVGGDRAAALPALEPHRRRALRDRAGQRDLGRPDVDGRVPPLEQPPRRHREARRVAHRPRPGAAVRLRDGTAGGARRPRDPRRARCGRLPQDQRRLRDAHLRPDPARARLQGRTPRRAGVRPRGRAPRARRRHHRVVAQEPRPAPPLRRLQPERARPHHRGGVLGPRPARRPGLDADPLGRGRRRRPARLHDLHGAGAVRRARRPARRHRRPRVRHRPAAGVGRPGRGRGQGAPR